MPETKTPAKTGTEKKNPNETTALEVLQKNVADAVLVKIAHFQKAGDIKLPKDYSPENALKSAWLILLETKTSKTDGERPVLVACTKESIANALLNMVIQGLNPVKKQCDFIAYGDKLIMQREYHGTIALARRLGGIRGVPMVNIVYEGDEFKYTIDPVTGVKTVISHVQAFENIDMNKIRGAYATLRLEDGTSYIEIMTMAQIRQAWAQGATHGQSPAHKNFPDRMAGKTVINRACTLFISTSDDGALFEDNVISDRDPASAAALAKMEDANVEELSIPDDIPQAEEVKNEKKSDTPAAENGRMPGF
jgi:recombination protein RecT